MYSNPPIHGARIVAEILEDENLTDIWKHEVKGMAERIILMSMLYAFDLTLMEGKKLRHHLEVDFNSNVHSKAC